MSVWKTNKYTCMNGYPNISRYWKSKSAIFSTLSSNISIKSSWLYNKEQNVLNPYARLSYLSFIWINKQRINNN